MQIIIPMSGVGERFKKEGYKIPKPLILVDNKPVIQHVVEMFDGESNFIFICNKNHLNSKKYKMKETLKKIAPNGKIIAINPHKKGPVYAVLKAIDFIDLNEPTIVNYADFTCLWDYSKFKKTILKKKIDGAIPCYKNFHPHTIWSNYYAYVKEKNFKVLDIQEKKPFTKNPKEEYASTGTYYFKSGLIMKKYFNQCVKDKLLVNNEYYVSMVYKPMIKNNLYICIYKINFFMQWGTPLDLKEYQYWSKSFNFMLNKNTLVKQKGTVMIPMAGLGKRFSQEGYKIPKPLISVSGQPMVLQALLDLPKSKENIIIIRKDLPKLKSLKKNIKLINKNVRYIEIKNLTDGQATTCMEGINNLNANEPLTIAACDNGLEYNSNKFSNLMNSEDVDIIVWGVRGYPGAIRNPSMYGWMDINNKTKVINKVSVKKPLLNTAKDPIIVGTFTFKKLSFFTESVKMMKKRKAKINNEYYIDMAINDAISNGLRCKYFEIDSYICWGTPNDLKTFQYWQACFHKWKYHPYKIEKDNNKININKIKNYFL